jgi:hypothetical protein
VQILRQLPVARARMVRGIVANEARDGSTPFARFTFASADGPVDDLLSRRRWSNPTRVAMRPWWNWQTRSLERTVL